MSAASAALRVVSSRPRTRTTRTNGRAAYTIAASCWIRVISPVLCATGVLGDDGRGLIAVGRLDLATSGLLLLTTDTGLAEWITDPAHAVPRIYVVTVRGRVSDADVARLTAGVGCDRLRAHAVLLRKASSRESHLTVELREGKNREVRRLFDAIGHEVIRLKRVRLGTIELGDLEAGAWRALTREDVRAAFPGAL